MRVDRHLDHRGWYPSAVRRVRSPLLHDRGPMARRPASQTRPTRDVRLCVLPLTNCSWKARPAAFPPEPC